VLTAPALVWFASINFLHFAVVLFAISVLVHLGVSRLFVQAPADTTLLYSREKDRPMGDNRANVLLSVLLVAVIAGLWLFFSPLFWH
jgi:solute:Na+ symporter, SSS family